MKKKVDNDGANISNNYERISMHKAKIVVNDENRIVWRHLNIFNEPIREIGLTKIEKETYKEIIEEALREKEKEDKAKKNKEEQEEKDRDVEGEEEFIIEKIIGHSFKGNMLFLKIKWRDYEESTDEEITFNMCESMLVGDYINNNKDVHSYVENNG